jgi:hypothetical protein
MNQSIRIDRRFAILDEWVLNLPVSDRAIRLYAILARYADKDTHRAYPSRATLADRLNCSLASVDRASSELVAHGAMSKQLRANSSIVYTLHTMSPIGVITEDQGGSSPVTRGVVTGDGLTIATEPEPPNENTQRSKPFDEFWKMYPRKLGTGEARQAFAKAVTVHGVQVILEGVQRFASDPNLPAAQFIPRAATWLNQERWADDSYLAPEPDRDGRKPVAKSPYVGGPREWVQDMHDMGEHFECRPGEFGCKVVD